MINSNAKKIPISLNTIPTDPGVYIYKDESGTIIYVGKAKNLKKRVSQYFQNKDQSPKTIVLVKNIKSVETIIVHNEVEALLLENKLIKKHSPKYNITLKDAKTYAYIKITKEDYPKIMTYRTTKVITKNDGVYFGPYTDGYARLILIKLCIQLFKLRICKSMPKKACLNFHIGLCTAPCIREVSKETYQKQVDDAIKFLNGNREETITRLQTQMQMFSKQKQYEHALTVKQQLESIKILDEKQSVDSYKGYDQHVVAMVEDTSVSEKSDAKNAVFTILYISKGTITGKKEFSYEYNEDIYSEFLKRYYSSINSKDIPHEILVDRECWNNESEKKALEKYISSFTTHAVSLMHPKSGSKSALVDLAQKNAYQTIGPTNVLAMMKEKLNLPKLPITIECFDISNLGTEHIVAGMTQFVNGKPNTSGYRRFLIKSVKGKNDDFQSMLEVVSRRYRGVLLRKEELPDLIIIDGGKGQLGVAIKVLRHLKLDIPIIGLAKEFEEIYVPNKEESFKFDKNSKMMLFIRQVRDNTHRYVLSYNRKRRQMYLREQFDNSHE